MRFIESNSKKLVSNQKELDRDDGLFDTTMTIELNIELQDELMNSMKLTRRMTQLRDYIIQIFFTCLICCKQSDNQRIDNADKLLLKPVEVQLNDVSRKLPMKRFG